LGRNRIVCFRPEAVIRATEASVCFRGLELLRNKADGTHRRLQQISNVYDGVVVADMSFSIGKYVRFPKRAMIV
jgi:hypothetical protein